MRTSCALSCVDATGSAEVSRWLERALWGSRRRLAASSDLAGRT
jgi:hypothetical protein